MILRPPAGRQLQVYGSQGKDWIIPCHCQADPEDPRIIFCEFHEKLPSASTRLRREVTFRPTSVDEDLKAQEQALRLHAAPRPEKVLLPIQIYELLDAFERCASFLLAGPTWQTGLYGVSRLRGPTLHLRLHMW